MITQEDEQLYYIKEWFKRHGRTLILLISAFLIGAIIAYSMQQRKAQHAFSASSAYQKLLLLFHQDPKLNPEAEKEARLLAETIIEKYKKTTYAKLSALILAKQKIEKKQWGQAKTQLSWVMKNAKLPALRQIARLRLAKLLAYHKQDTASEIASSSASHFPRNDGG
jgi:predicted negative regulator of RcsB-dependent stress response